MQRAIVLSIALAGLACLVLIARSEPAARGQTPPQPSAPPVEDAAQALADRFAPIMMLKAQRDECDARGEPYAPISVDFVLDNPGIVLRQVGNGDPVIKIAPGASDLFGLGGGFYLDFPGDGLSPGCIYERDNRRYLEGASTEGTGGADQVVYAHIVQEEGVPDQLALQFWFFWYFNDWNNKHEGDWEGIQLLFDSSTVEEALASKPRVVGYAQHEGGEAAEWDDDKLERRGDHPVVYPSAGSHASYYGSALYIGRSGAEGFGCDNTEGPSVEVRPRVVVLPDAVTDPDSPLAWLAYRGRWGEQHPGPFSGPTGPTLKDRWLEPVSWQDGLRNSGVRVPGGRTVGSEVLAAFCGIAERGSLMLIRAQTAPLLTLFPLAVLLAVGAVLVRRTAWYPPLPLPLVRRRSVGQILTSARSVYMEDPGMMVRVGLVYLPINLVTGALVGLLIQLGGIEAIIELFGERSIIGLPLSVLVGGLGNGIAQVFVLAAVAVALARADGTRRMVEHGPYRSTFRSLVPLASAFVRAYAIVIGLVLTVVGLPWAIRQMVRYTFFPQVVMIEGERSGAASLRRSSELVVGHWWRTAWVVALVNGTVFIAGFAIGLTILVLVPVLPLWAFNATTSIVFAVIVPLAAAATALLYGDLVQRSTDGASPPAHRSLED